MATAGAVIASSIGLLVLAAGIGTGIDSIATSNWVLMQIDEHHFRIGLFEMCMDTECFGLDKLEGHLELGPSFLQLSTIGGVILACAAFITGLTASLTLVNKKPEKIYGSGCSRNSVISLSIFGGLGLLAGVVYIAGKLATLPIHFGSSFYLCLTGGILVAFGGILYYVGAKMAASSLLSVSSGDILVHNMHTEYPESHYQPHSQPQSQSQTLPQPPPYWKPNLSSF